MEQTSVPEPEVADAALLRALRDGETCTFRLHVPNSAEAVVDLGNVSCDEAR